MSVQATRTQTSLRRRASEPGQLDTLLEKLCSLGLPLLDVHRFHGPEGAGPTYEVRVDGRVGEPLLQYLNWRHTVVPGRTRVRIAAASGELHQFLRACTACGASIQQVRRVDGPEVAMSRLARGSDPASAESELAPATDGVHTAVDR